MLYKYFQRPIICAITYIINNNMNDNFTVRQTKLLSCLLNKVSNYLIKGSSSASAMVEGRTKGCAPEPPPTFQFVTTNNSQATLYLTQWDSGGCDITHFTVQYKSTDNNHWTTGKIYSLQVY